MNQSFENAYEDGEGEAMQTPGETVASREPFFGQVALANTLVLCGDDRALDKAIRLFGGVLNGVYSQLIMRETSQPGSVTESFEAEAESLVPVIVKIGGMSHPTVHSDSAAENGEQMRTEQIDGKVGCGYAELRQAISESIVDNRESILADAKALRPELFNGVEDDQFAGQVIDAHGRLAERQTFFTSGRRVVLKALSQGVKPQVLPGGHEATEGIINLVPNTGLDGGAAVASGLKPVYNHDAWAAEEIDDELRARYPYDKRQQQIANLIDTIGTMRALGVEIIEVRRPESADVAATQMAAV